ncbi:short-chain dehydrogenase TIC 32 B, chloroplastic-like isoform X3 [Aristolochia californica]|uniref:short-chain dehydrogenase TIC 32 B, chloroplastic-like isoform X3 n=1 Tax=Aristolochia californica TaxID=171875 RepID=UPI0035E21DE5
MKGTLRYLTGAAGPSGFGSNSTAEQVTEGISSLIPTQLTAIITGATSGIGAETARVMAKRGVRLVIPARDLKKAAEIKEEIKKEIPKAEIIRLELDLSSFASIKRFSSSFLALGLPLNILINNAGKFCPNLEFSDDKFEMTFATNYLGHFLLTELLAEKMVETAARTGIEGRIINVSSVIHGWVKREKFQFNDLLNPKNYNGTRAYAQSKLANIFHAKELARRFIVRLKSSKRSSDSQCYPSRHCEDWNHQRPEESDHRFSVFPGIEATKIHFSGRVDNLFCCPKPSDQRSEREVLGRLQSDLMFKPCE